MKYRLFNILSYVMREPGNRSRRALHSRYTLTYSEGTYDRQPNQDIHNDTLSRIVREHIMTAALSLLPRYTLTYSEGTLFGLSARCVNVIHPHV